MHKRRSVALMVETSNAYARGLLDGIIAYQREHELWSIYLGEHQRGARPPRWFNSWKGDGIIARIESEAIAAAVRRLKLPTVDVSAARRVPNIPWVETDDREIAHVALRHLLDRGFRNLAFCGEPGFNWSAWREEHFVDLAEQAGCRCFVFAGKSRQDKGYSWTRERRRLTDWVRKLPKPVGMMACYDFKGQQLLDVCRELDVAVPEQVAVVGVDNDARLCGLCVPPLSSVIPDTFRAGYEAAKLLDGMMAGAKPPTEALLFPPLGIAQRHSSDVYAIDDAEWSGIRYPRARVRGIRGECAVAPLSRRMLSAASKTRAPAARTKSSSMSRACRLCEDGLPLAVVPTGPGLRT
jgi:LacI family transcriptional regulator